MQSQSHNYVSHKGDITTDPFAENKVICYYFSASWCGPCVQFTPMLTAAYNSFNSTKKQLEIIFVSSDRTPEEQKKYFEKMPWICIPHGDPRVQLLKAEHKVSGIPMLVVLNSKGVVICPNGRGEVMNKGEAVFEEWAKL